MYTYLDNSFPKRQCSFRKGYNAKHRLIAMIERMKEACDKNKSCASAVTDLSKGYNCLKQNLLITKSNVFGFDFKSLRLIST